MESATALCGKWREPRECAETAGAASLFMATFLGIPVSTTHTIAGGIIGVGATRRLTGIKWDIAIRISPARPSSPR